MAKGKSKPRREERKKPKPRYAWLLPLVLVVPMASGCAPLDRVTEEGPNGEPSMVAVFGEKIEDTVPAPWGHLIATVLGVAGAAYAGKRRRDKAKAAA